MENQYLNRFQEPTYTRLHQCPGCKGRTTVKLIEVECWECRGEGWMEDDDWMWNPKGWTNCYACDGKGYWKMWSKYCSEECYEYDHYED